MRCALVALTLLVSSVAAAQRSYPQVTIPNTEVRSLRSHVTGRSYDLYVYLPSRYGATAARKYPVLYLLDAQWDFKLLTSMGGLLYDRFVPDVIVVGITYSGPNAHYDSLRAVDYTPKASLPRQARGNRAVRFLFQQYTEVAAPR
jgi:predicted alpha/beta superfamily hydrolase